MCFEEFYPLIILHYGGIGHESGFTSCTHHHLHVRSPLISKDVVDPRDFVSQFDDFVGLDQFLVKLIHRPVKFSTRIALIILHLTDGSS